MILFLHSRQGAHTDAMHQHHFKSTADISYYSTWGRLENLFWISQNLFNWTGDARSSAYDVGILYILFAFAFEVRVKWQLAISWQYLINPTIVLGCSPIFLLWEIRRSCLFKSVRFNVVPNWLTFASVSHWFKFSVPPQKWDARNYYNLVHKSAVTMLAFEWTKKNIKH